MANPMWYEKQAEAEQLASAYRRLYKNDRYEVVRNPNTGTWGVALIADNGFRIREWMPALPKRKKKNVVAYQVEYTDTFCGEANYCWVKRATIEVPLNYPKGWIMRKAKESVGIRGLRGRSYDYGDMIEFRPWRMATVLFITSIT